MKLKKLLLLSVIAISTAVLTSCQKEGCTNYKADNYDSVAKKDDGSCRCESTLKFINETGEDYTIYDGYVSSGSSAYSEVISAYGTQYRDCSGTGSTNSGSICKFTIIDESNGGILISNEFIWSCDDDGNVYIY